LLTKGHLNPDIKTTDIVVISMYAADKLRLNEKLKKERSEFQEDLAEARVLIVDASQSAEFKIVIIRLVSGQDSAGFITSMERINVALSRAQHLLFIVGNLSLLSTQQYEGSGKVSGELG